MFSSHALGDMHVQGVAKQNLLSWLTSFHCMYSFQGQQRGAWISIISKAIGKANREFLFLSFFACTSCTPNGRDCGLTYSYKHVKMQSLPCGELRHFWKRHIFQFYILTTKCIAWVYASLLIFHRVSIFYFLFLCVISNALALGMRQMVPGNLCAKKIFKKIK